MRHIIIIAHDIRSRHNVGSLLRTADGIGVECVYLTGYTPYPAQATGDPRLPHLATKETSDIAKTALGAERSVAWEHRDTVEGLLKELRTGGYHIVALEQATQAVPLPEYRPIDKVAVLLGREVEGIDASLLRLVDTVVEIPMFGKKESFNVVQAASMVLYHLRFGA